MFPDGSTAIAHGEHNSAMGSVGHLSWNTYGSSPAAAAIPGVRTDAVTRMVTRATVIRLCERITGISHYLKIILSGCG